MTAKRKDGEGPSELDELDPQAEHLAVLPSDDAAKAPEPTPATSATTKGKNENLPTDKLGWKKLTGPKPGELKLGKIRLTSYYQEALSALHIWSITNDLNGLPDFEQSDIVGLNVENHPGKQMFSNLRVSAQAALDMQKALDLVRSRQQQH